MSFVTAKDKETAKAKKKANGEKTTLSPIYLRESEEFDFDKNYFLSKILRGAKSVKKARALRKEEEERARKVKQNRMEENAGKNVNDAYTLHKEENAIEFARRKIRFKLFG